MNAAPGQTGVFALRALLLATALTFSQTELLERRPELSKYQDAWKTLTLPGKFYLYMRSYEDEPLYGHNRKCVFSEVIFVNEEEKYTVGAFGSADPNDGTKQNITVYSWVRATEGYPAPNVMEAALAPDGNVVMVHVVAFSEYSNCEIFRVPHRNDGCELWGKAGELDKIKSLCFYVFHLLCGPDKYLVYDKNLCERK
ncbi:female-specific histamine-binding protein 2-like [Haemaphysalis longicornis]